MSETCSWPQILDAFFAVAGSLSDPIFAAIDPGAHGAIGFLCSRAYTVIDIPTIETQVRRARRGKENTASDGRATVLGSTTSFDYAEICKLFQRIDAFKDRVVVVLEKIPFKVSKRGGYGYSDVAIGRSYAMWPLFLCEKGYVVREVAPVTWKAAMNLTGKDKEASRLQALKKFPSADLHRKKDHDRAEALLMCVYAKRTHDV